MPKRDLSVHQLPGFTRTEQYSKDLNGNLLDSVPVNIKWTTWYADGFARKNRKLEILLVRLTPNGATDSEWSMNWSVDGEPPEETQRRQQSERNYRKLNDLPAPVESLGETARRMFGIAGSLVMVLRHLRDLCQPKRLIMPFKNTNQWDEAHIRIMERAFFEHHAEEISKAGYRVEEVPVTASVGFMWEPAFYRKFQFVRL